MVFKIYHDILHSVFYWKMRKCVIQVKGEDLQKGTFHGWSDKLFEVGDKVKSQMVAIVELESGIVREIYPTDITFV